MTTPAVSDKRTIVERYLVENSEALAVGMTPRDIKKAIDDMLVAEGLRRFRTQLELRTTIEEIDTFQLFEAKNSSGSKTWKIVALTVQELSEAETIYKELGLNVNMTSNSTNEDIYAAFTLYLIDMPLWKDKFLGEKPSDFIYWIERWLIDSSIIMRSIISRQQPNPRFAQSNDIAKVFYGRSKLLSNFFLVPYFDFREYKKTFQRVIEVLARTTRPVWMEAYERTFPTKEEEEAARKRAELEWQERQKRMVEWEKIHRRKKEKKRMLDEDILAHSLRTRNTLNGKYNELKRYGYVEGDPNDIAVCDLCEIIRSHSHELEKIRRLTMIASESHLYEIDLYTLREIFKMACLLYGIRTDTLGLDRIPYVKYNDPMTEFVRNSVIYDKLTEVINSFVGNVDLIAEYSKYDKDFVYFYDELPENIDCFSIEKLKASKKRELYKRLIAINPNDYHLNRLEVKRCAEGQVSNTELYAFVEHLATPVVREYYERIEEIESIRRYRGMLHEFEPHCKELRRRLRQENSDCFLRIVDSDQRHNRIHLQRFQRECTERENEVAYAKAHDGHWYEFNEKPGVVTRRIMHYNNDRHFMFYYLNEDDQRYTSEPLKVTTLMADESKWIDPESVKVIEDRLTLLMNTYMANRSIERVGSEPRVDEPNERMEHFEDFMEFMMSQWDNFNRINGWKK